jgi:signal transduction histidine kinase
MLVVLLTLVVGSFLLLGAYRGQLIDSLDLTLEQQVADRAALLESGGSRSALVTVLQDEAFVWIGTTDGEVIAQGGAMFPLESPVPASIGTTVDVSLLVEERKPNETERERMELRIASAETTAGDVVLAGSELETIDQMVRGLAKLFALAVPVMVVIVGALAWFITGRALQPVAAIRTQAEAISGMTLTERVPVPDSHDEIGDLAVTVNQMLDRLERHDRAIRQFSSDASHELKSPVANIRAMVETRSSTDPTWGVARQSLVNETNRLGNLVDNLLFLASHQDGDRPQERNTVQLDELIFAEAELISETTQLRVDLSTIEPAAVEGSTADLSRLLRNLVDNAARHADERIALSLQTTPEGVRLSIADDGDGVVEQDREKIFERFTRLDEARTRDDGGTGLGLSIVAQVAQAHGASINVGDAVLGGAVFTVSFPRS